MPPITAVALHTPTHVTCSDGRWPTLPIMYSLALLHHCMPSMIYPIITENCLASSYKHNDPPHVPCQMPYNTHARCHLLDALGCPSLGISLYQDLTSLCLQVSPNVMSLLCYQPLTSSVTNAEGLHHIEPTYATPATNYIQGSICVKTLLSSDLATTWPTDVWNFLYSQQSTSVALFAHC